MTKRREKCVCCGDCQSYTIRRVPIVVDSEVDSCIAAGTLIANEYPIARGHEKFVDDGTPLLGRFRVHPAAEGWGADNLRLHGF